MAERILSQPTDIVVARLGNALSLLAEAKTIQETKKVLDVAAAAEVYAKRQKLGQEAEQYAASIKIEALAQLGRMLRETPRATGAAGFAGPGSGNAVPIENYVSSAPTLADMGLDKKTSSLAQKIAELPEEEFAEVKAGHVAVSKAIKRVELSKRKERIEQGVKDAVQTAPVYTLSPCAEWLEEQPDADLLLTDPPYMTDVDDVQQFADAWLPAALSKVKPTGRAYVFVGAYPEELRAYLNTASRFGWLPSQVLVWTYRNTLGPSPRTDYKLNWQACLYFCGPDAMDLQCADLVEQFSVQDVNAPDGRRGDRYHAWQKPLELAQRLVRHSTNPGDVVLDPFAGTGTHLLAASTLGRFGLGCDIDPDMADIAEQRGCVVAR